MSVEAIEKLHKAVAEERELNEKLRAEVKKNNEGSAETKAALAKAEANVERISEELKAVQTAMNRHQQDGGGTDASAEQKNRSEVFHKFMRHGKDSLSEVEIKSLSSGIDSDGGFLVRPEVSSEIQKKVFESSPMRALASSQSISSNSLEILHDLDEVDADWVAEKGSRANSDTAEFKKTIIMVNEIFANPLATQQILDDASINLEAWLAEKVSEKIARKEATAFVAGTGVGQPRGILTYASGTTGYNDIEQVNSGSAATITADGLISLVYKLKAPYKVGASFLMQRATVAAVRKLKDTTNQYLWQPSLQVGAPDMLLGFPIHEADDMPALGAGALSVAFGNFKTGYQIVDRLGIRVLRDPFSNKPYVGFYTTKRVGGAVKNFEAIKIGKCSA